MRLFYAPGTCAMAAVILADWLELDIDLVKVSLRPPSPELLAVNPLGAVPAVQLDDGQTRTQVDAILQHFTALKPEAGLDAVENHDDRFLVHQWIAFLTGDFHPPFGVWFNPARFTSDHSEHALEAIREGTAQRIARLADLLDEQVGTSARCEHVVLNRRTLLDPYAYAMVRWLRKLEGGIAPWPNLERFLAAMEADPGVQRALSLEHS